MTAITRRPKTPLAQPKAILQSQFLPKYSIIHHQFILQHKIEYDSSSTKCLNVFISPYVFSIRASNKTTLQCFKI